MKYLIGFVVENPPTQKEYLLNMEQKIEDTEFLGDIEMLLRPNEIYNPQEAWELVKKELIEKLWKHLHLTSGFSVLRRELIQ